MIDVTIIFYLICTVALSRTGLSIELRFVSKRVVIGFGFLFDEAPNTAPQDVKTLRCFQPVFVVFVTKASVRLCAAHDS